VRICHILLRLRESGRIEFTKVDTVFAFANGIHHSILIPATTKRGCITLLRTHYQKLQQPYIKLFSVCLFILLREHIRKIDTIIIDIEFDGHEGAIKGELLNYIRVLIPDFPKGAIVFTHIGKHSPAHFKAYDTYAGKLEPDYIVTQSEIVKLLGK